MEAESLVSKVAATSLSKAEQLALIRELENNIKQKEAKEQEDTLSKAAKVIANRLKQFESKVEGSIEDMKAVAKVPGPRGADGRDGKDGKQGPQGVAGRDGLNGKDGVDGQDGQDGQDGKSIVDVYFAADGNLVCLLSDGTEIDAGIPLSGFGGKGGDTLISNWAGYSTAEITEELKDIFIAHTFETINKNLPASDATLAYDGDDNLITVTYASGVLKTLAYNGEGDLITVTLSGATPADILLIKTLGYDSSGNLTSVAYT